MILNNEAAPGAPNKVAAGSANTASRAAIVIPVARFIQNTEASVSRFSSGWMISAAPKPAAPIMARNWMVVSATATEPNSSGVKIRARIGTVTNLRPNVAIFDEILQIMLRLIFCGVTEQSFPGSFMI
ncbi:hypothetical protein ROR02_02740 [Pararhodospirillum oryzae]|uniref:Uncharacterized protein n=1 Tax=Pararhodospirillum oryzae TaxID=478448 RepID=A0A512H3Y6_9PROT|nr:hypothetical protein ROR02_02740 [Pararhodospirillum oryzae]